MDENEEILQTTKVAIDEIEEERRGEHEKRQITGYESRAGEMDSCEHSRIERDSQSKRVLVRVSPANNQTPSFKVHTFHFCAQQRRSIQKVVLNRISIANTSMQCVGLPDERNTVIGAGLGWAGLGWAG